MRKKKFRIKFHPNACKKLVRYARAVKKELGTWEIMREIGRRLDVNSKYIHDNLVHGIEPTDATPTGRAARVKMMLPEHKPKPKTKRQARPKTSIQIAIQSMVAATANAVKKIKTQKEIPSDELHTGTHRIHHQSARPWHGGSGASKRAQSHDHARAG